MANTVSGEWWLLHRRHTGGLDTNQVATRLPLQQQAPSAPSSKNAVWNKKRGGGDVCGTIKQHCGHRLDGAYLRAFVPHKLFYFCSLHFNANTSASYSLHFQNRLSFNGFEGGIISFCLFCHIACHPPNITGQFQPTSAQRRRLGWWEQTC